VHSSQSAVATVIGWIPVAFPQPKLRVSCTLYPCISISLAPVSGPVAALLCRSARVTRPGAAGARVGGGSGPTSACDISCGVAWRGAAWRGAAWRWAYLLSRSGFSLRRVTARWHVSTMYLPSSLDNCGQAHRVIYPFSASLYSFTF